MLAEFFCLLKNRDEVEVHKHVKEEQGQYPLGQSSAMLPDRVANHSAGFGSSCPLIEIAI